MTFVGNRCCRWCRKVAEEGDNILVSRDKAYGDARCVASGDTNVVQRHEIED
jgi:hypothetical protein